MAVGRPATIRTQLGKIVAQRDGRDVTAEERIVQLMEVGNYIEPALRQVGIPKATAYRWFDIAARALAAKEADRSYRLTADERAAVAFRDAVWDAEARGQSHLLAILEREGRGGFETTITTTKLDREGNVVEVVTRTEVSRPDVRSIMWRLERRFPELWGRQRIEVTGPDGGAVEVQGTIAERATALAEGLQRLASDRAASNGHTAPASNGN